MNPWCVTYWHPNYPGQFYRCRVSDLPVLVARYPGLCFEASGAHV